jgi:hypothetical protein
VEKLACVPQYSGTLATERVGVRERARMVEEPLMETPHLTELVRRMRLEDPDVAIRVGKNGAASIVWCDPA